MINLIRQKKWLLLCALAVPLLLGYFWIVNDVKKSVHSSVKHSLAAAVAREKIEETLLGRKIRLGHVKNIGIDLIEVCIDESDATDYVAIRSLLDSIEYTLGSEGVDIQIVLIVETSEEDGSNAL